MDTHTERLELQMPADAVHAALTDPERFVATLPGVTNVYRYADDRYGFQAGQRQFEVTVEREPPRRLRWRTADGEWTGGLDLESLGASRTLVVVTARTADRAGDGTGTPAALDAGLRALRQAFEAVARPAVAADGAGGGAEEVFVYRREAGGEPDPAARDDPREPGARPEAHRRDARAGSQSRDDGDDGAAAAHDAGWRGSRASRFPGRGDAFAMVRALSREVDKLWEQMMRRAATAGRSAADMAGGYSPAIEIDERDDVLIVSADVPGVAAESLRVAVDPELLVIRGERHRNGGAAGPLRAERQYGRFVRRIPLPQGLDTAHARARLHHGVLDITIPVLASGASREVPVEPGN